MPGELPAPPPAPAGQAARFDEMRCLNQSVERRGCADEQILLGAHRAASERNSQRLGLRQIPGSGWRSSASGAREAPCGTPPRSAHKGACLLPTPHLPRPAPTMTEALTRLEVATKGSARPHWLNLRPSLYAVRRRPAPVQDTSSETCRTS